jgi:hypothetical protein
VGNWSQTDGCSWVAISYLLNSVGGEDTCCINSHFV